MPDYVEARYGHLWTCQECWTTISSTHLRKHDLWHEKIEAAIDYTHGHSVCKHCGAVAAVHDAYLAAYSKPPHAFEAEVDRG